MNDEIYRRCQSYISDFKYDIYLSDHKRFEIEWLLKITKSLMKEYRDILVVIERLHYKQSYSNIKKYKEVFNTHKKLMIEYLKIFYYDEIRFKRRIN